MTDRGPTIRTERLILRRWRASDRAPFAALNADPEVMEFFVTSLSVKESDQFADSLDAVFDKRGFGMWAVEVPSAAPFIGIVGITPVDIDEHFTPAVEAGWRLARRYWGRGYAPEAARAAMSFGFDSGLDEIVAQTARINARSRRVMEKLGMTCDPADDFDHPRIPSGHRLNPHVLYRVKREDWLNCR